MVAFGYQQLGITAFFNLYAEYKPITLTLE